MKYNYTNIKITYSSTNLNELNYLTNLIKLCYSNIIYKNKTISLKNIKSLNKIKKNTQSLSILKSPHVNKTAWHQFKKTTFKQIISLKHLNYLQLQLFIKFIYTYKPSNINLTITCIK